MKRALYACVSVWILIFLLDGCAIAPKKPDEILLGNYTYAKEYLTWLIQKEMKKNQVMGLSIAIVDDQTIVWAQGFGYADAKLKIPATPETIYRIGSISKLFTVTATMQLAEQGIVDIDQPIKNYLPQFSVKTRFPDSDPITLRVFHGIVTSLDITIDGQSYGAMLDTGASPLLVNAGAGEKLGIEGEGSATLEIGSVAFGDVDVRVSDNPVFERWDPNGDGFAMVGGSIALDCAISISWVHREMRTCVR